MRAGLPTLATEVGGVAELVRQGVSGLLVPPGDVTAMAEGLEYFFTNRHLLEQYGAQARSMFVNEFECSRMLDRMKGVYCEAVGRTPKA